MYLKVNSHVGFEGEEFFPGDFLRTKSKRLIELGKAEESTEAAYNNWLKNKDKPAKEKKPAKEDK